MAPMGPETPRALRNPTWEELVTSRAPRVRELPEGERPRDWLSEDSAPSMVAGDDGDVVGSPASENEPLPLGPLPHDLPPVTGPQQYQVQFSTVEDHATLVERARALLSHERPGVTLGELHLQAMRLLVATLEKRKFAATDQAPRQRGAISPAAVPAPRQRGTISPGANPPPRRRGVELTEKTVTSPQHSRYIPAGERREVYRRDGARCTFVDARGERCSETHYLELHHLQPFARRGANLANNLTLRCAAHNALAAEQDFGSKLMADRRDGARHESLAAQVLATPE